MHTLIKHRSRLECGGDGTMKGVLAVCLSCGVLLIVVTLLGLGHCTPVEYKKGMRIALLEHGCSSTYQRRKGKTKINKKDQILYLPVVQT